MAEPAAQHDDWIRALEGIDYPVSMTGLRRTVMGRGGIDHEVLNVLNGIDADNFDSEGQVLAAVREKYAADGVTSPI